MIVLNEHLHKTISSILETVSAVDAFLNEHKELSADHLQQVSYCCAELALLSLTAHDELDDDGTAAERINCSKSQTLSIPLTHIKWKN